MIETKVIKWLRFEDTVDLAHGAGAQGAVAFIRADHISAVVDTGDGRAELVVSGRTCEVPGRAVDIHARIRELLIG